MNKKNNLPKLETFINGDDASIAKLYDTVLPKVTAFVINNKGSESDAKEVFQNALFQIMVRAKVKGVHIKTSLDGYIYVVCRNLWYKELNNRKKEVRNTDFSELKDMDDSHVKSILDQERLELFEEMMLKISDKCTKLLKDYFNKESYVNIVEKYSYASESVASQQVYKCKKRLRDLIMASPLYKNLRSR